MELSPMRPLHRGAATAAALLLSAYPPNRLTAQRPLQATDYYKLVVVANPELSPDGRRVAFAVTTVVEDRSEEHTSELQSQSNLVCRLLLEKKKIAIFRSS